MPKSIDSKVIIDSKTIELLAFLAGNNGTRRYSGKEIDERGLLAETDKLVEMKYLKKDNKGDNGTYYLTNRGMKYFNDMLRYARNH